MGLDDLSGHPEGPDVVGWRNKINKLKQIKAPHYKTLG